MTTQPPTAEPMKLGGLNLEEGDQLQVGNSYIFYGSPGSGKTHLAAEPLRYADFRTLFIITDGNADATLSQFPQERLLRVRVQRFAFDNGKGKVLVNNDAFGQYCDVIDGVHADWAKREIGHVVIDSGTTVGDFTMDYVLLNNKVKGRLNPLDPIHSSPEIQHYGHQIRMLMADLAAKWELFSKNTGCSVVAIFHSRTVEHAKTHAMYTAPSLTSSAALTIGKDYEEMYYLEQYREGGQIHPDRPPDGANPAARSSWRLLTRGHDSLIAKTTINSLPDVLTGERLSFRYIQEERERFNEAKRKERRTTK